MELRSRMARLVREEKMGVMVPERELELRSRERRLASVERWVGRAPERELERRSREMRVGGRRGRGERKELDESWRWERKERLKRAVGRAAE